MMRRLYPFVLIYMSVMFSGCALIDSGNYSPPPTTTNNTTEKPTKNTAQLSLQKHPLKDPVTVAFYKNNLHHPYKILGKAIVSKYNKAGIKRQEAVIHDTMRNLAASIGGDAVINIKRENKSITGTVISFG